MDAMRTGRTIAVDWSGAKQGERRKIWLAEVQAGRCVRLESRRTRAELTAELIAVGEQRRDVIVGLDFAFSFPEWLLEEWKVCSVQELWRLAALEGERWLATCAWPFWGRPRVRRSEVPQFRKTESDLRPIAGIRAKSTLQIGGAGAVGTGSIRGMPTLARLRDAGFSIWPFDPPNLPLVVEIYPRLLTGPVAKSNPADRSRYLQREFPTQDETLLRLAATSEDAFDAFVSAVVMDRHRDQFRALPYGQDPIVRAEGMIWAPVEVKSAYPERA